jgi:uncharacterized protein
VIATAEEPLSQLDESIASKLERLRACIRGLQSVLVCYSGGIDSALVLVVAHEQLGARAVAMTAVSPSLPESERQGAEQTARTIGARHHFVVSNELGRAGYVQNAPDRCFHCKTELYELAELKRREWRLAHILNGTNQDDLGDYRPGLDAARNAGVVSPLLSLGFGKQAVREAAKLLGLRIWSKPAAACLASRIPYGTSVTEKRLAQIAGLEARLHDLGFEHVRVRYHDTIARIEVAPKDFSQLCALHEQVVAAGKANGFAYVTMDLQGYRQGSHNELLAGKRLKLAND